MELIHKTLMSVCNYMFTGESQEYQANYTECQKLLTCPMAI